jgi:hypothetical protein
MDRKLKTDRGAVYPGSLGKTKFILVEICTIEVAWIGKQHKNVRALVAPYPEGNSMLPLLAADPRAAYAQATASRYGRRAGDSFCSGRSIVADYSGTMPRYSGWPWRKPTRASSGSVAGLKLRNSYLYQVRRSPIFALCDEGMGLF